MILFVVFRKMEIYYRKTKEEDTFTVSVSVKLVKPSNKQQQIQTAATKTTDSMNSPW